MTVGQGLNLIRATFTTTFCLMLEGNIAFVIVIFLLLNPFNLVFKFTQMQVGVIEQNVIEFRFE